MNNFSRQNETQKSVTIFLIFVFVLLCNTTIFSQTSQNNVVISTANERVINEVKVDSKASSNVEFVLWFMGSKQDPNSTISTEGINTKKQIMTSGLAPNRLLIKAFLKKAVNFDIGIA